MEIGEPVALRKLPRTSHSNGKVHFGSVWALRSQHKRKRHEICTAVDGDSVNIYDIKTGRTIFSHAVPPSSAFACAPTSVRWKEDDHVYRQTCFAVRDDGLSLISVVGKDAPDHGTRTVNSLRLEDESSSPVLYIDISLAGADRRIAVIQADGTLTLSVPDLQHTTTHKLREPRSPSPSTDNSAIQLISATVITLADAQKSVLKSREDLSRHIPANSSILVAVSMGPSADQSSVEDRDLRCGAWSILDPASNEEPQMLFDYSLPLDALTSSKRTGALIPSFGRRASTLILKSANDLQRIELTGLVPRVLPMSHLGQNQTGCQDILLIGSGTALVAFQDSFRLLDLQYNTIYANLELNQTLLRRKRKRGGPDLPGSTTEFIGYFPQINRVLVFSRHHLMACDLSFSELRRGPGGAPLLVDQIGKGAPGLSHRIELKLSVGGASTTRDWTNVRETLTVLRGKDDNKEFEKTVLSFWKECSSGDSPDSHYSASALTEQQINFILSNLFSLKSAVPGEEETQAQVQLDLIAPTLIHALNEAGILSAPRLKRALSTLSHPQGPKICDGDIPVSLMVADATYETLAAYVDSCVSSPPSDIAAVIRLLLSQILQHADSPNQRLIAAGTVPEAKGDSAAPKMELMVESVSKALSALAFLDTNTISTQLQTFSQTELPCLIQFLRQDLYQRSQAGSVVPGQLGERVALEVGTIIKILSACIDAINPLDLGTGHAGQFLAGIISDLLSEVSLATDAAEESAHLQGTLRETLRYHQSKDLALGKATRRLQGLDSLQMQRRGTITTLYCEEDGPDHSSHSGVLPLGVGPDKVQKSGRQLTGPTVRAKRMLQSQRIGAYRFERLVL